MPLADDRLIVVTGAAGFIGSATVRYLNDQGMTNLLLVDDLGTTEKWKNLVGKQFIDLISKHELLEWLDGRESLIQAFIHLGACSNTLETDASYLFENNYRYSVELAEYALQHGHRFIYASSAATYGDGKQGFHDNIDSPYGLSPLNMYGFSKQLFDQWVWNNELVDQLVGLKYFNVFGPNEAHKGRMASAITKMVPQILKGENVRLFKSSEPDVYADGEQKRDFIYVKDVVKMTCAFLDNQVGGIYNIGSGIASTWNALAHSVYQALDRSHQIEYIDMPVDLINKYQNYSCADMNKTRHVLGNQANCMSLEDSVRDYVCHYLLPDKRW